MKNLLTLLLIMPLSFIVYSQSLFVNENKWLCGKWEGNDQHVKARFYIAEQQNYFKGVSAIETEGQNTLSALRIFKDDGRWILSLLDEKKNKVFLEMKRYASGLMVFERSEQSFPQKISYYKMDSNLIRVALEGMEKGKMKQIQVYLMRIEDTEAFNDLQVRNDTPN
jgi:hypothetical protein